MPVSSFPFLKCLFEAAHEKRGLMKSEFEIEIFTDSYSIFCAISFAKKPDFPNVVPLFVTRDVLYD